MRRCARCAATSPTSASRCTSASGSSPRPTTSPPRTPQTLTVAEVLGPEGLEELARLGLGYTPTWGTDALREAIARPTRPSSPRTCSSSPAPRRRCSGRCRSCVGPGDGAVVTVPNYQSMESVPLAAGADVRGLALRPEDGWALDLDALERRSPPPRSSSPSTSPTTRPARSPTRRRGSAAHPVRGARDPAVLRRGLPRPGARGHAAAAAGRRPQPTAISLGVMSKSYGLPGLRIGWLATRDRALLARLETRKHYTSICSAGPSELIATAALRKGRRSARATARSSPRTSPSSTRSSPATPTASSGRRRRPAASASPATSARTASRPSRATSCARRASCCFPPRSTAPSSRPSPATASASASAALDPEPALEAFDRFLRVHSGRADGS